MLAVQIIMYAYFFLNKEVPIDSFSVGHSVWDLFPNIGNVYWGDTSLLRTKSATVYHGVSLGIEKTWNQLLVTSLPR